MSNWGKGLLQSPTLIIITQSTGRGTETCKPPRGSNFPLPFSPQPLISSNSNQATNSNAIVIHVVNYLFLQKIFSAVCSVFQLKSWGWTMESGAALLCQNNGKHNFPLLILKHFLFLDILYQTGWWIEIIAECICDIKYLPHLQIHYLSTVTLTSCPNLISHCVGSRNYTEPFIPLITRIMRCETHIIKNKLSFFRTNPVQMFNILFNGVHGVMQMLPLVTLFS